MASIIAAGTTSGSALNMTGDTSGQLQLQTNGTTTAVTIDTSQNVGIGTTSPTVKLQVNGDVKTGNTVDIGLADANNSIVNVGAGATGNKYALTDYIGDTTYTDYGLRVGRANDGANGTSQVLHRGTGALTIGAFDAGNVQFLTSNTERMRITSTGTVLINATSSGSNTGTLHVNGNISSQGTVGRQGTGGTSNGNFMNAWWTGSALQAWIDTTNVGNFSITSDYRIKKNIETSTTLALGRIAQIRPVTYEFANYKELFKEDGIAREGFIAHELAEVIPSAVEGEKDAENQIQSLKLDALCSVMVKAIQEQQTIINDLKARIETLEGAA